MFLYNNKIRIKKEKNLNTSLKQIYGFNIFHYIFIMKNLGFNKKKKKKFNFIIK